MNMSKPEHEVNKNASEDSMVTPESMPVVSLRSDRRPGLHSTAFSLEARRAERERMVATQIEARGIRDSMVLHAMRSVPREAFVPSQRAEFAYDDAPIPIGDGQTMSPPYIVALLAASVKLKPTDRVLEIGTGSGYGAAILSKIAAEVYTVERVGSLADSARRRLAQLGYGRVSVLEGNLGWRAHAPHDAIVVTAADPLVPATPLEQLVIGGRLIMPVRQVMGSQLLRRVTRTGEDDYEFEDLWDVAVAPHIGAQGSAQERRERHLAHGSGDPASEAD